VDPRNVAVMMLSIFTIAGVLIVASVVLGVFFGTFRRFFVSMGFSAADNSFTSLHLDGR
jgi:hypothetical protein